MLARMSTEKRIYTAVLLIYVSQTNWPVNLSTNASKEKRNAFKTQYWYTFYEFSTICSYYNLPYFCNPFLNTRIK